MRSGNFSIVWISVFGLYLELLLIRWIGTEIRIFAYLQNTVLVTCFLGLGAGLFTARKAPGVRRMLVSLVLLVGLLSLPVTREPLAEMGMALSVLGDFNVWYATAAESPAHQARLVATGLLATLFVMVLLLEAFVPIGRLLGRWIDEHPHTLTAYSLNVVGSLVGTWLFVGLSVLLLPPVAWFAVLAILALPLVPRANPWPDLALLGAIVAFAAVGGATEVGEVVWSPYQKLALSQDSPLGRPDREWVIRVNNAGYQGMLDLSERHVRDNPGAYGSAQVGLSQYDLPALLHPRPRAMLVVGAGAGNDVAGALRQGVDDITAVEIDPAIIDFGRRHHPERPYASDRVRIVIDDARSFFATTRERYDVISFGLLDAHTTTSMTNARLDHYVYTRESIARAKALLADDGVMVLSFYPQRPFIADRIAGVLHEAFGRDPLIFRVPANSFGWGGVMFVAGDVAGARARIQANPRLALLVERWQRRRPVAISGTTAPATDDWPYLYLDRPRIPSLYLLLAGLTAMLVVYLRVVRGVRQGLNPARWTRSDGHFASLGAGFLLLEVQNISKASVALGNTWQTNAVIISGVLAMALVGNAVAARWPRLPLAPTYVLLLGSIIALYFVELGSFAALAGVAKVMAISLVTTLPMALSGIVFVRSLARARHKGDALGANLLGALAGAMLQSLSFLVGIQALLLVVAAFYVASWALADAEDGRAHEGQARA